MDNDIDTSTKKRRCNAYNDGSSTNGRKKRCRNRGKIHLIVGCMYSGKTENLLKEARRRKIADDRCLIVRYAKDNRYSDVGVISHDKRVELDCIPAETPQDIELIIRNNEYDCCFIDEVQFFQGITEFTVAWAKRGLNVYLAGLDAWANQTMCPEIVRLIPFVDTLVKLTAICPICGEDASQSKDILATDNEVHQIIGGRERYRASCRDCLDEDQ